ncbi:hypothetical protein MPER_01598, partial [Moniliophthora perniciosa FA553]
TGEYGLSVPSFVTAAGETERVLFTPVGTGESSLPTPAVKSVGDEV